MAMLNARIICTASMSSALAGCTVPRAVGKFVAALCCERVQACADVSTTKLTCDYRAVLHRTGVDVGVVCTRSTLQQHGRDPTSLS